MTRKFLMVLVVLLACVTSNYAQVLGPADVEAAAAGNLPVITNPPFVGSFWTWKEGLPLPFDVWPDLTVYDLGAERGYLIDNRSVPDFALESMSPLGISPLIPTGAGPEPLDLTGPNYGCQLWLSVAGTTNNPSAVLLTVHGTRAGQTYPIWSTTNIALSFTNWPVETNVLATGDPTEVLVLMGGRPDLFFRTADTRDYNTNAVFGGIVYADKPTVVADTMGAVGPNHFVELLNSVIAVYAKSGQLLTETNIASFFSMVDTDGTQYPTQGRMTDPRILYDPQSQRWVATALDYPGSDQVILAVSNGDSPTNLDTGWTRYLIRIRESGLSADYDTLGLDANGIYITALQLGPSSNDEYGGHNIAAVKKPEIYRGTNLTTLLPVTTSELTSWTIQPVVSFDASPAGGYAWFLAKGPPSLGTNYQGGSVFFRRLLWSGTNAAWADASWLLAAGTNYQDYYDLEGTNTTVVPGDTIGAPQLGTTTTILLSGIGSRLMNAVSRNGVLWTCQTVGLAGTNGSYIGDASGINVDRTGVQWLKFQVTSNLAGLTVAARGRVFDGAGNSPWWYYFPSIAANCPGDMVTAFSGSSESNYIGFYYFYRINDGRTVDQPRTIRQGTISFVGNRWGDYSATTVDPSDDWSFWPLGEYATPYGTVGRWGTTFAQIRPSP